MSEKNKTTVALEPKHDVKMLKTIGAIPQNAPDDVCAAFLAFCEAKNLSPLTKEVYLSSYTNRKTGEVTYTPIVGIEGFQKIAARTGRFAGVDAPRFDERSNGTFKTSAEIEMSSKLPISCTVTVYAIVAGIRCPFSATLLFKEYYPAVASGGGAFSKAKTMPLTMIAKCARAAALRIAFSELGGLNIEEEIHAMKGATISDASVSPSVAVDETALKIALKNCATVEDVKALYRQNKAGHEDFADLFADRKAEIEQQKEQRNEQ